MEHEKSYVYQADAGRPAKRRRVERNGLDASLDLRKATFKTLWEAQEQQLKEVIHEANAATLHDIREFITSSDDETRLPVGLVTLGTANAGLFDQLSDTLQDEAGIYVISLTASDAPNLKTLLKTFIARATQEDDESDAEDEQVTSTNKQPKLLNYDLERLRLWSHGRHVRRLAVVLQASEAFDTALLSSFLLLLKTWLNRLPFVVLLGVTTTVDFFEERLPHSVLKSISGRVFAVMDHNELLENVFARSVAGDRVKLRLGPALSDRSLQRQRDFVQSTSVFIDELKYAYMCHFHGNPLSVFLHEGLDSADLTQDHFEAVRNLDSFRSHIETLLDRRKSTYARSLLQSNEALYQAVTQGIQDGQAAIAWMLGALRVLQTLRARLMPSKPPISLSSLYIKVLSGDLVCSPTVRELLLQLNRAPSDILEAVLPDISDTLVTMPASEQTAVSPDDFYDLQNDLAELISSQAVEKGQNAAIANNDQGVNARRVPLRASVTSHKFALGKQRAQVPPQETPYSAFLTRFHDLLLSYFTVTLTFGVSKNTSTVKDGTDDYVAAHSHVSNRRNHSIFLHEILFYDIRASHSEVFQPRPRPAVERALTTPHDYLACACCRSTTSAGAGAINPNNPTTVILYQLSQESGALINVMDLWTAFRAVIGEGVPDQLNGTDKDQGPPNKVDDMSKDNVLMAAFMRGLAELKYLGMIRGTRRGGGTDCVAKGMWRGV